MQEFYRVNSNLPISNQIKLLNEMILALNGMVIQGKFDINEIVALYSDLGSSYARSYARSVTLGNTQSTYTGWTHVHAESGYSIWKFAPTNYAYSSVNQLYFNDRALENRGEAANETATAFDNVLLYNGDSGSGYTDITTDVSTDDSNYADLMNSSNDYVYIGDATTFNGFKLEFETRGSNYTLVFEYYNGATWEPLDGSGLSLTDNTTGFISDGLVEFDAPIDWDTVAVDGTTKYWVRISTTTEPVSVAQARVIIPAESVVALLALSSSEILNEDWAWCSYNSSVYVTIRNSGATAYEGEDFITSASSAINLQNFYISNNEFKSDYLLA